IGPLEIPCLVPLTPQSSPSSTAVVCMLEASDPTLGSLMAAAPMASPALTFSLISARPGPPAPRVPPPPAANPAGARQPGPPAGQLLAQDPHALVVEARAAVLRRKPAVVVAERHQSFDVADRLFTAERPPVVPLLGSRHDLLVPESAGVGPAQLLLIRQLEVHGSSPFPRRRSAPN